MNFIDYLKSKGRTHGTINSFNRVATIFLNWLDKEQIEQEQASYADILSFMKHCQKQGATQRTVQNYLNAIRHLYDHLIEQGRKETGHEQERGRRHRMTPDRKSAGRSNAAFFFYRGSPAPGAPTACSSTSSGWSATSICLPPRAPPSGASLQRCVPYGRLQRRCDEEKTTNIYLFVSMEN